MLIIVQPPPDFKNKLQLANVFYNVKESESRKNEKLVHYDVLSSDEHERVYTRIFFDEMQSLIADESLLFQNMHFSISPAVSKKRTSRINTVENIK